MKMRTVISLLLVLSIVSILTPLTSSAQDADVYMYWADHGNGTNNIRRANLDGTNVQDIATGFGRPVGIALDLPGGKIYWTDRDNVDFRNPNARNSIRRMNLDGTNIETLVTGGASVKEAIALDTAGGKMYWVDWNTFTGTGKIQRANLDGTNVEDVVSELIDPRGIALDLAQGKMYWTDGGAGKIQRANFDGSNIEDLVTGAAASYLSLDFSDGKIYWANYGAAKIQRANFDGSNVEDIVVGLNGYPTGIALDTLNGKMYWGNWFTNFQGSKIQRANLDDSNVEDLVTGVGLSVGIALSIPQTPGGLRFSPNTIADQTFTLGSPASLTLPMAIGGTPPYTYSPSALPPGLQFDPVDRWLNGTPTTLVNAHSVTYTATDATGASASLTFTITVEAGGLPLDVNADGRVDVLDLVWVAVSYQMRGDGLRADVNADGVVNIQDLVAVAEGIDAGDVLPSKVAAEVALAAETAAAREGGAGAPVMGFNNRSAGVSSLTAHRNVTAALADVRSLGTGDVRLGKWMPLLEGLLQVVAELRDIPETTALLPNYPNPFNPETWIPYHLAEAANVTVTIYDVRGVLVRELTLGHQSAGVYESRGRAAYWDGKNQTGEPVASGLYFYTLSTESTRDSVAAGDCTATRKLLIAK